MRGADMFNIALLLAIVLIILSVAAVNILGLEAMDVYGSFGLGTHVTIDRCMLSDFCASVHLFIAIACFVRMAQHIVHLLFSAW